MLCVCIPGPSFLEALSQIDRANHVADLLEFRIDLFDFQNIDEIAELRKRVACPVIFTIRKKNLRILEPLLELDPEYIDLEWDVEIPKGIKADVIVSYHDFQKMPEDLAALHHKMQKEGATFYKIACMANSSIDALRMLEWMQEGRDRIGICMGSLGEATRILGPRFGCPITYSCLDSPIASGQIDCQTLIEQYHFRKINQETQIYGLIGDPVSQSPSHHTHNAVMRELNLPAVYLKFQVKQTEIKTFLQLAENLGFSGFSVTMPLKERLISDAVNTMAFPNHYTNTDGIGALNAIEKRLSVKGKRMLILGAGGTAKAVARESKKRGANLFISNRTEAKAQELAKEVGGSIGRADYDIVVNATSAGMQNDFSFFKKEDLSAAKIALEVVIDPAETAFTLAAKEKGCEVIYGKEMFVLQAVEQFAFWFGNQIERERVQEILWQN